jgi:glyceraldehyde-3-phosphate dehydrogenase (NADP+)
MKEKRDDVVRLLMWEIGKALPEAEKEFDRTVDYIRDTIDALKDLDRVSSRFVIEQGVIGQIRRAPLGVVLCMGPFNYPLNETFTTLIPALIMGNTVIFKPPKFGVLLHEPLLEAFRDCFPKGVVNTIYGEGQKVIGPLMTSGRIDVLAFIGSSRVADILKKQHPKPHRLRCILGLEAKNAGIVLKDADLDQAVKECVLGALSYNGQRCTALKMLFVHRDIVDAFIANFGNAVDKIKSGMPWEAGVFITPLPEPTKTAYLMELIDDARAKGASVINRGGGSVEHTFMTPAIVYPVDRGMRLYSEEQFGPVVPIAPFSDFDEAMNYVIQSDYGQQVSVFGSDPQIIADLVDPLVNQVCRVNINSQCQRGPDIFPFTGRKDSAEGTLSVSDALRVFTIRTLVAAKETDANKQIIKSIVTDRSSRFLSTDFIL